MYNDAQTNIVNRMMEGVNHLPVGILNVLLFIFEHGLQDDFCNDHVVNNVVETDDMSSFRSIVQQIAALDVDVRTKILHDAKLLWAIKETNALIEADSQNDMEKFRSRVLRARSDALS